MFWLVSGGFHSCILNFFQCSLVSCHCVCCAAYNKAYMSGRWGAVTGGWHDDTDLSEERWHWFAGKYSSPQGCALRQKPSQADSRPLSQCSHYILSILLETVCIVCSWIHCSAGCVVHHSKTVQLLKVREARWSVPSCSKSLLSFSDQAKQAWVLWSFWIAL